MTVLDTVGACVNRAIVFGSILTLALPLYASDAAPDLNPTEPSSAAVVSPIAPVAPVAPANSAPSLPTAPSSPQAVSSPSAVEAVVAQPTGLSPGAAVQPANLSPAASAQAQPLSQSVSINEEPMVPEEAEDPMSLAGSAPLTDLKPISSTVLARLAAALSSEQDAVWLDAESGDAVVNASEGASRVDAVALYGELARRLAQDDDKDARAALSLAILKKDSRAKDAKDQAFEDKLADSVIAQVTQGDLKAKAQLQSLAQKGNRRARQFLGLDAAPPNVIDSAPTAVSPAAQTVPEPVPVAVSPGSKL